MIMLKSLIHIGTSGWSYEHWKEVFYPRRIRSDERLHFYSQHFNTVEINNTFYHLPTEAVIERWNSAVPNNFLFSIKASQYITHRKRLKDPIESTAKFIERITPLGRKLGPILFQLPPNFKQDISRLENFLSSLDQKLSYTFEFRHPTWFNDEVYELLKKYHVALCITDLGGQLTPMEITAKFTYIRLHGPTNSYSGSYGTKKLHEWKNTIKQFHKNKIKCYCYFDNDEKGYAIKDAIELKSLFQADGIPT